MAWSSEKNKENIDLVWSGSEFGIASSPFSGTANIQNANISTQTGEIMASFGRVAQQQATITNGTLTPDGSLLFNAPANLQGGQWIKVTASTVSSITAATDPTTFAIDYLAVGGGGGSGGTIGTNTSSGGGGAGEVATGSDTFTVGSFAVTVGAGGVGGATSSGVGGTGGSTIIETVDTAVGGGGGGAGATNLNGASGASGGGGGAGSGAGTGGSATAGNAGGAGNDTGNAGGGGGGAGGAGGNATSADGGAGGAGVASSITGVSVTYGGGGGGGAGTSTRGPGGTGGGGNGGTNSVGTDGVANTGGGAGGNSAVTAEGRRGGSGIAVIRYLTGAAFCTGGDRVYQSGIYTIHVFLTSGTFVVHWINPGGLYFVSSEAGGKIKLSDFFDPYGDAPITHGTTGSITFSTVAVPNKAISKATEVYNTATTTEYRYYILDQEGYVWVYDTQVNASSGFNWMLTDPADYSNVNIGSIAILNGWLIAVAKQFLLCKPTVNLGSVYGQVSGAFLTNPFNTHRNFALTGTQGKLYYTDNQFIGELFPTSSLVTSEANIQSYCKYTASSTTGTITELINGSTPYLTSGTRVPVVLFTDSEGTLPTAITPGVIYYLLYNPSGRTFTVFTSATSTSALDIATGAVGNQYFNTFFPQGAQVNSNGTSTPLFQFQPQRVNLPFYEQATCLVEVDNTIIIGCEGSVAYPWNQVDSIPSGVINLPEAGVQTMINVNNIAYIFAGNKGNIYITNGSQASLTLKVPDYVAGVPGDVDSYVEPYFTWGDSMYCRGRVYFSILDQTANKAGNCGGVWSFVPIQNVDPNQQIGMALRLENQNSYGTYNGYATILIPAVDQQAISPQYWSAWQNGIDNPGYGIDFTSENPVTQYVVETDILMTGTMLQKQTFKQLEYKLTTPLLTNDSISIQYRLNSTSAWATLTGAKDEPSKLSGFFNVPFQKTEWVQFRILGNTGGTTASSFTRLKEIRLR